jgi:hypothetical protein
VVCACLEKKFSLVSVFTGQETFDKECMVDPIGQYYTGTMNTTLSGAACQAWSSQFPHVHPYDDMEYFPDNVTSLNEVANYCRNPSLGTASVIDVRPWCYLMKGDSIVDKEYCDIPVCKGRQIEYFNSYSAVAVSIQCKHLSYEDSRSSPL